MKKVSRLLVLFALIVAMVSSVTPAQAVNSNPNLAYFGYLLTDAYHDDPYDGATNHKMIYDDEVSSFTNLSHLLVADPAVSVVSRMQGKLALGMLPVLDVQGIFWETDPVQDCTVPNGFGVKTRLRPDYQTRWSSFVATNTAASLATAGMIYIADEPVWNGITEAALKMVSDLVYNTLPTVAIFYVEAYTVLDNPTWRAKVKIPVTTSLVGFDHYGVYNPYNGTAPLDVAYRNELGWLKAKRTGSYQKIILIMDTQYYEPDYPGFNSSNGHPEGPWYPETMATVQTNYHNLAKNDQQIIGMFGYVWPGGFVNQAPTTVTNPCTGQVISVPQLWTFALLSPDLG